MPFPYAAMTVPQSGNSGILYFILPRLSQTMDERSPSVWTEKERERREWKEETVKRSV